MHTSEAYVALRRALVKLADSDVELAGARIRSSVAESALKKAREEAEAWSFECGKIEINEKNNGIQGWFATST
jgi:hypothetical protein